MSTLSDKLALANKLKMDAMIAEQEASEMLLDAIGTDANTLALAASLLRRQANKCRTEEFKLTNTLLMSAGL